MNNITNNTIPTLCKEVNSHEEFIRHINDNNPQLRKELVVAALKGDPDARHVCRYGITEDGYLVEDEPWPEDLGNETTLFLQDGMVRLAVPKLPTRLLVDNWLGRLSDDQEGQKAAVTFLCAIGSEFATKSAQRRRSSIYLREEEEERLKREEAIIRGEYDDDYDYNYYDQG